MKKNTICLWALAATPFTTAYADQQIQDDLVVVGSGCFGLDCVNGESFGFDTIRLKENNLRIRFVDSSSSSSFPTVDWQITANDSANGGANRFSIDEIDSGRTPFTILAGAPSHSLYVNSSGFAGFGTSAPLVNLHSVYGNTPTLRLEQDGSSGFSQQTWDVAGNETNFFIRDTTNGSALPFKIRAGAPNDSIYIAADGDVGLGTDAPSTNLDISDFDAAMLVHNTSGGLGHGYGVQANLEVRGQHADLLVNDISGGHNSGAAEANLEVRGAYADLLINDTNGAHNVGAAQASLEVRGAGADLLINDTSTDDLSTSLEVRGAGADVLINNTGGRGTRTLLALANKGDSIITATNTKSSSSWSMTFGRDLKYTNSKFPSMCFAVAEGGGASITNSSGASIFSVDGNGNMTLAGSLSQSSDREVKENFEAISTQSVLETLASIPVTKWNYIGSEATHMGPMAQDFWQAFGLGQGETTISTVDADGIALASIQALYANQQAMAGELEALREYNAALNERVERLETLLELVLEKSEF